jgi:hypothetical protein
MPAAGGSPSTPEGAELSFGEVVELLDGWSERKVSVVVRGSRRRGSSPVAFFTGRLGVREMEGDGDQQVAFFPVQRGFGETMGLRVDPRELIAANGDSTHLQLGLGQAMVTVAAF